MILSAYAGNGKPQRARRAEHTYLLSGESQIAPRAEPWPPPRPVRAILRRIRERYRRLTARPPLASALLDLATLTEAHRLAMFGVSPTPRLLRWMARHPDRLTVRGAIRDLQDAVLHLAGGAA